MLSPVIPILILLTGAILAAIGATWRFRYTPIIQAASATLAIIALAWVGRALPQTIAILIWRPISLFGTPIVLGINNYAWALGLALLVPVLASSLRQLANPRDLFYPASLLAMSAIMLGAIGAANLLTLVLAWGLLDVVYCFVLLSREGLAGGRRAELVIGINGIATLLAWAALVFLEQDKLSSYWRLMTLPPVAQILLGAAALLRVGLYPLYAWSSTNITSTLGGTSALGRTSAPGGTSAQGETASIANLANLMPMMAGLALWVRLAVIQTLPTQPGWVWVALALAAMASLLAWVQTEARRSIAYVAIGYAGLLIVAGSLGLTAALLAQGAVTWVLGIYALTHSYSFTGLYSKLNLLWGLPALIAIAALFGLPATIGVNYRAAMHTELAQASWVWWSLAALVEALLASAALRYAFAPQPAPALAERTLAGALKSLALPIATLVIITLPLVIFGLWPSVLFAQSGAGLGRLASARGWAGWLAPWIGILITLVILGLKIKLADQRWLVYAAHGRRIVARVLDMTWLYDLLLNSLRRLARLIGGLATLTEGKGALVWMILFIVLALLYLNEPGR